MPENNPRRFGDALHIQGGACNPHAIARSLVSALDECRAANMDTRASCADPAVRLIAHQLAFLLNVARLDSEHNEYSEATKACEAAGKVAA
jgi:hypothetical protein